MIRPCDVTSWSKGCHAREAVDKLFGAGQARQSALDWIEELELVARHIRAKGSHDSTLGRQLELHCLRRRIPSARRPLGDQELLLQVPTQVDHGSWRLTAAKSHSLRSRADCAHSRRHHGNGSRLSRKPQPGEALGTRAHPAFESLQVRALTRVRPTCHDC
jgi:hypothetical protein